MYQLIERFKHYVQYEPARVTTAVRAILTLLVAAGFALTDVQVGAIVAVVAAPLDLVTGEVVRAQVVPKADVAYKFSEVPEALLADPEIGFTAEGHDVDPA